MFTPRATRSEASRQISSTRRSMPASPSSAGQVMSIVRASKTLWSTWRSFSSCELRRIGCDITSWWQWSGVSSSRLISGPMQAVRLITTDSRIGSIAGLVTCANSCLKYENSGGLRSDRLASATSLPIEPVGSAASRAIGARITLRSSSVQPKASCLARSGSTRGTRGLFSGRSSMCTTRSCSHSPYGRRRASSALTSSSGTIRSRSRSTRKSLPGRSRPFATIWSGVASSTPVSEASTTQPSLVTTQRPGRRPLRSSVAPITRPSVKATAAGPVPGLDQRRVVGVEVAHLLRQLGPALVGLGDQHRHGVRGRAPAQHEQLHQAVERGRVGDVVAQEAADLVDVVAEQRRGERELAGAVPVAVAAQRVDLAVVGEHPVRVGQLPAREGVGGEARVDQREPRDGRSSFRSGKYCESWGAVSIPL